MKVGMGISRRALLRGLGATLLLGLALPATAQNLLANGDFNGALTSWTNFGSAVPADGTRSYAPFPDDAGAVPTSGSAQLQLGALATGGVQIGLSQCVPVIGSQAYNYGARAKLPTGQSTGQARALVDVVFFSDAACATPQNLGEQQGLLVGTAYALDDSAWRGVPGTVPTTAGSVVSPPGAGSAQFRILIERANGAQAATARFDRAFFGVNLTPVQLQSYSVE